MSLETIRHRVKALEMENKIHAPEPWPPDETSGQLSQMFYKDLVESGIQLPEERPQGSVLMYLLGVAARTMDWSV